MPNSFDRTTVVPLVVIEKMSELYHEGKLTEQRVKEFTSEAQRMSMMWHGAYQRGYRRISNEKKKNDRNLGKAVMQLVNSGSEAGRKLGVELGLIDVVDMSGDDNS